MSVRPLPHFLKACGEGLAVAAVVDILHVHDLEARLIHDVVRIEGRIRRQPCRFNHVRTVGVRVLAALAVSIDVELNLADAAVKLLGEGLMLIVESFERIRIFCQPDLHLVWRDAGMIAIVRTNDLNLIDVKLAIALRWRG